MIMTARPWAAASWILCRLIFRVHVVVLNLTEGPLIEAIEDFREAVVMIVEGEAEVGDARRPSRPRPFPGA